MKTRTVWNRSLILLVGTMIFSFLSFANVFADFSIAGGQLTGAASPDTIDVKSVEVKVPTDSASVTPITSNGDLAFWAIPPGINSLLTPEPMTSVLIGSGLLVLGYALRRRKRS